MVATAQRRGAMNGFLAMVRKEFIQMRRDRLTLGMMVGLPALQLLLFGYAIRTEVRVLPAAVLDESRTAESRALIQVLENTGSFRITGEAASRQVLDRQIESGNARAAIVIPPDYARRLKRRDGAQVQVVVDAADPLASQSAMSAAALAGASYSSALAGGARPPLEVRVRPRYNPGLRSEAYIVPGIIGVLLSITMLVITSMAVVRERERGTLEQLIVTPLGKGALMLGKVLPFVLVGYVQMTVILLLGRLVFDVPVRGSVPLLYLIVSSFIMANLGIGLFISTLARSQAQAMQMAFFVLLPNILLSGFMFPREAMPVLAQWIGLALPLTYFLEILRGILLKDVGLAVLWPETLVLSLFAAGLLALSAYRFSKTLE
ncbi:MAG TPA: ABC transporter permease [Gemmatimonadaceae bacterium]